MTEGAETPSRPEARRLTPADVHPRQSLGGFALAPDGRRIALLQVRDRRAAPDAQRGRVEETPLADVCLLPAGGGYPQPLTATGDVPHPAVWSPDGRRLLLERDGALRSVPLDGGPALPVFSGALYRPRLAPGDAHLGTPRWSPDGRSILLAVREAPETSLLLVGADGRTQRRLMTVAGTIAGWDWAPDGRRAVVVTLGEDAREGTVHLLDVADGAVRTLWREAHAGYQKPLAAWADGEQIVLRSNRSGWSKLLVFSAGGPEDGLRALTTGAWDESAFRLSADRRRLVFASRADQPGSGDDLWSVPVAGGAPARLTRHPGVNVPYGWGPDGRIAYWHSSPTEPGDLWSIAPDDGSGAGPAPQRLTWSAPLELEAKLRPPDEVVLTAADGQAVSALVYLPAGHEPGRRYPPIVWVKGGPTGAARFDYAPLLSWLANEGFLVVTPNYRGSTGYGVPFMEAVAGDGLGRSDLADVLAAGEFARAHPAADTARGAGIGGRSWGGYLTLMAVTRAPEAFACAVAGAAISDWTVQQAQTETRAYDRWLVGGWLYEREALARERSPVAGAGRVKAPLFVYHGEADLNVPFAQIGPFVDRVRQAGASVEYVTYPLEGHSNQLPANQADVLEKTRAFFRRHLQPWNFRDNPTAGQTG